MMPVVLCADTESLQHPEMIGLAGENLAAQEWLQLFSSAQQARAFLRNDSTIDEVWVASSDDVEAINVAAAIKQDKRSRTVCLLAFQGTGSLWSRASAAGVDATLSHQAFAKRYASEKRKSRAMIAGALPAEAAVSAASAPLCVKEKPIANVETFATSHIAVKMPYRALSQSAFLLPVVSGSGGSGKSTVAALAAALTHRLGYKTLLVDFDLQFGDMRDMLGMPDALTVDDVLADGARLAQVAGNERLPALLAAPRRLEQAEAVAKEASFLLDAVASQFDVVVANTGAFWADQHVLLLERCSKALFLVDQRPSSLRACRHAVELCARCGVATSPFLFVVNRCAKGALYTSIDVSCAMQGAHAVELSDGGREVEELLGAGMPLDLIASRNDVCTSLERVLVDVLPAHAASGDVCLLNAPKASRGFFRKRRAREKRGAS